MLDENFPKAAAELLEGMGHTVYDARERGLIGASDSEIMEVAIELRAALLTTDRDFFHTLHHAFPEHCGVVVIALRQPKRTAILDRLKWFLNLVADESLSRRAFQLRDTTWLAHPPFEPQTRGGEPGDPPYEDSAGAPSS